MKPHIFYLSVLIVSLLTTIAYSNDDSTFSAEILTQGTPETQAFGPAANSEIDLSSGSVEENFQKQLGKSKNLDSEMAEVQNQIAAEIKKQKLAAKKEALSSKIKNTENSQKKQIARAQEETDARAQAAVESAQKNAAENQDQINKLQIADIARKNAEAKAAEARAEVLRIKEETSAQLK
jgi:Skp family chaperone for outer membrane proteins